MTQINQIITDKEKFLHEEVTSKIIECFYKVYNQLGYGFLERVYQNAFFIELKKCFTNVEVCKPIKVKYDGIIVGDYFVDIIVDSIVIIEIKAI